VWCIVRVINAMNRVIGFWFGGLIGLGMETKYSTRFSLPLGALLLAAAAPLPGRINGSGSARSVPPYFSTEPHLARSARFPVPRIDAQYSQHNRTSCAVRSRSLSIRQ
jgi:hypothetical protein